MEERTGEAFELGEQLTVIGGRLKVGDAAPAFTLDHFDPEGGALGSVSLGDTAGKVRLLNIVNSLDTPVCNVETKRWEENQRSMPPEVVLYTVSMDLPYAQARWMSAEGAHHQALSSHRSETFGQDYGVLIKEWRLLQRAVIVIDGAGKVAYAEYVADQMKEPDYGSTIAAVKKALGQ